MKNDREALTITSREQLRREIEEQVQRFLHDGGHIEVLETRRDEVARPIGPVWWDSRGSGPIALLS